MANTYDMTLLTLNRLLNNDMKHVAYSKTENDIAIETACLG